MPVTDYQFETQGLTMGPGTPYIVTDWTGYGTPDMRNSDDPWPLDHGTMTGPEYYDGRGVTLSVVVRGDSPSDAVDNADALLAAWQLDTRQDGFNEVAPLTVKIPGRAARRLHGRPRRASLSPTSIRSSRVDATLEYFAPDPRWYSADLRSEVLNIGTPATGRSYPRQYNYGYGGGQSNSTTLVNAGNFETRPVITITGTCNNPRIQNVTTGRTLRLNISLTSPDFLVVDCAKRTVLLNGTASRYAAKVGDWLELAAGANQIRLLTDAGSPIVSVDWRDAWL